MDDRKTADVDISPVTLDGEETAEEGESVEVGISPVINGGEPAELLYAFFFLCAVACSNMLVHMHESDWSIVH